MTLAYPASAAQRDKWILDRRLPRGAINARTPRAFFLEQECGPDGQVETVAAIFLTGRECPFRCTMCDLWRHTLTEPTPTGSIPEQIDFALSRLGPARSVKLYNSGSFFDPRAVPPCDYEAIAARVRHFERVIVECHPAFLGERCIAFRDLLRGTLEVAMGLETAAPEVLEKLNKRMTLDQFSDGADFLRGNNIDLRVFILVQPPFMKSDQSLYWARRSLDFAFKCSAGVAALIPTRGGNGVMEVLSAAGEFAPPTLNLLEDAAGYGLGLQSGRVFVDLWDVDRHSECPRCFDARIERLREMNIRQVPGDAVICDVCRHVYGRPE